MYKNIVGGLLVSIGAVSFFVGASLSMRMMIGVARLKSSKAPLALGDLSASLDKHPRMHPLNKESSKILRLLFFGLVCLMIGGMILFDR